MGIKISKIEHSRDEIWVEFILDNVDSSYELLLLLYLKNELVVDKKLYLKNEMKMSEYSDNSISFIVYTFEEFINKNPLRLSNNLRTANINNFLKIIVDNTQSGAQIRGYENIKISTNLVDKLNKIKQNNNTFTKIDFPIKQSECDISGKKSKKRISLENFRTTTIDQQKNSNNSQYNYIIPIKNTTLKNISSEDKINNNKNSKDSVITRNVKDSILSTDTYINKFDKNTVNTLRYSSLDNMKRTSILKESGKLYKQEFFDQNNKLVYVKYSCTHNNKEPIRTVCKPNTVEVLKKERNHNMNYNAETINEIQRKISSPEKNAQSIFKTRKTKSLKPTTNISNPTTIFNNAKIKKGLMENPILNIFRQKNHKSKNSFQTFNIFKKMQNKNIKMKNYKTSVNNTEKDSHKQSNILDNEVISSEIKTLYERNKNIQTLKNRKLIDSRTDELDGLFMTSSGIKNTTNIKDDFVSKTEPKNTLIRNSDFMLKLPNEYSSKKDSGIFTKRKNKNTINNKETFEEFEVDTIHNENKKHIKFENKCDNCCFPNNKQPVLFSKNLEENLKKHIKDVQSYTIPTNHEYYNKKLYSNCSKTDVYNKINRRYNSYDKKLDTCSDLHKHYNFLNTNIELDAIINDRVSSIHNIAQLNKNSNENKLLGFGEYNRIINQNYHKRLKFDGKGKNTGVKHFFFAYK